MAVQAVCATLDCQRWSAEARDLPVWGRTTSSQGSVACMAGFEDVGIPKPPRGSNGNQFQEGEKALEIAFILGVARIFSLSYDHLNLGLGASPEVPIFNKWPWLRPHRIRCWRIVGDLEGIGALRGR